MHQADRGRRPPGGKALRQFGHLHELVRQLTGSALVVANDEQLSAEEQRGIGLARRGAGIERLGRNSLRRLKVTLHQHPDALVEQPQPDERGLPDGGGQRPHRLQGGLHLRAIARFTTYDPLSARRAEAEPGIVQLGLQHDQLLRQPLALPEHVGRPDRPARIEERMGEGERIAGGPAYLECFGRQAPTARRIAGVVELDGQQREHLRTARVVLREGCRRGLERLHALGVDRADLAAPPSAVGEHGAAEAVRVANLSRERCRVEQGLAKVGVPALALGLAQADQQIAALRALPGRRPVVELERLSIPARGLAWRELLERALGGSLGIVQGLGRVVDAHDRCRPMARELPEPLTGLVSALLLEPFRDSLVQSRPAGGAKALIERVLDQRVGEGEAPGPLGALPQERRRNRLIEQVEEPSLGQVDGREQKIEVEVAADDRGGAERRAGVGAQALNPPSDHLAHALGQAQLR